MFFLVVAHALFSWRDKTRTFSRSRFSRDPFDNILEGEKTLPPSNEKWNVSVRTPTQKQCSRSFSCGHNNTA